MEVRRELDVLGNVHPGHDHGQHHPISSCQSTTCQGAFVKLQILPGQFINSSEHILKGWTAVSGDVQTAWIWLGPSLGRFEKREGHMRTRHWEPFPSWSELDLALCVELTL